MTQLPFGEWLPDLPAHKNPGALIAKNCIPEIVSYRSMNSLQSFTNALVGACLGSVWARTDNGDLFNFAGDQTQLYELQNSVNWTNVSRTVGGAYNAANWDFTQFGNRVIATNIANETQFFDMGVSTNFENLPNAPFAQHVDVVRDFVVLGDVDDSGRENTRVQWSGFNNSEQWGSSAATQAGAQDLRGRGGEIRRVIGGDVGHIFQERSITRMSYIGPPLKFRFDEVERARGAAARNGVVWTGAEVFYYAADGFYKLNLYGGENSVPIGANRVNKWFKANVAPSEIENIDGAIDFQNRLVMWAFKTSGSRTVNDRVLIYNWQADKWSYADIEIQTFAEFTTTGFTLDQLDGPLPQGVDLESINVDSTAFAQGNIGVLAFGPGNVGATFSGAPLSVCLDTKEFGNEGALSFVKDLRPLIEDAGGELFITPITRNRLIDSPNVGLPSPVNAIGQCDIRANARYHRYRLTGASDFTHAEGVEFQAQRRGKR